MTSLHQYQDDGPRSRKTFDSWNFDSCQSFQVTSMSDWSANQAFGESQRKQPVVIGTLIAKYDF